MISKLLNRGGLSSKAKFKKINQHKYGAMVCTGDF